MFHNTLITENGTAFYKSIYLLNRKKWIKKYLGNNFNYNKLYFYQLFWRKIWFWVNWWAGIKTKIVTETGATYKRKIITGTGITYKRTIKTQTGRTYKRTIIRRTGTTYKRKIINKLKEHIKETFQTCLTQFADYRK